MGDFKIIGLEQLGKTLDLLPQSVEKRIIRRAVRQGANVIEKEVEVRVPRDTGELASEITVKSFPARDGGFTALIGVRYQKKVAASSRRDGKVPSTEDPGVYAQWVEFGRPGALGHTHQEAHPFMRPAFDTKVGDAEEKVGEEIMQGIEKELH